MSSWYIDTIRCLNMEKYQKIIPKDSDFAITGEYATSRPVNDRAYIARNPWHSDFYTSFAIDFQLQPYADHVSSRLAYVHLILALLIFHVVVDADSNDLVLIHRMIPVNE